MPLYQWPVSGSLNPYPNDGSGSSPACHDWEQSARTGQREVGNLHALFACLKT
ncbi:MAG: hypothetical protein PHF31_08590 [Methylobacter sp.]|nr:hypothetical protein [Methylobacter sp.]